MNEPFYQRAVELLSNRAQAIRAVRNHEMNEFSSALADLQRICEKLDAPVAIVGGLAAIHFGVAVTTSDIDLVVPATRLDEFLDAAQTLGFEIKKRSRIGWHVLTWGSDSRLVEVHILPEGGKAPRDAEDAPSIPSPAELGVSSGLAFASFASWVALKLLANRDKDRYHLVEALKAASQHDRSDAVEYLRHFDARYLPELQRLVQAAEAENQDNW